MCPRENLQSSEVLQYYKLPICAASAFLEFNENVRNYFKAYVEIKQDSVFIQEYPIYWILSACFTPKNIS